MRVDENGKCIKHGFGQFITDKTEEIKENDENDERYYHEVITTEIIYIGYWEDDKKCGLGK